MATLLATSQFHSVAFTQLLQTLRHCYDSQVTEQLHNNSLFFIKCPKLLLTLQKCFKAFNLENDTARQRTPHRPTPGRGPVVADYCSRPLQVAEPRPSYFQMLISSECFLLDWNIDECFRNYKPLKKLLPHPEYRIWITICKMRDTAAICQYFTLYNTCKIVHRLIHKWAFLLHLLTLLESFTDIMFAVRICILTIYQSTTVIDRPLRSLKHKRNKTKNSTSAASTEQAKLTIS